MATAISDPDSRDTTLADGASQNAALPIVLVVDDDPQMPRLIKAALAESPTDVRGAASFAECLKFLRAQHPDAILLDIVLPDANGLEAFRQIHEIAPKVPVVFITATNSSDTAIEAMKLGAFDYLMKPLDFANVKAVVRQALEVRKWMNVPVRIQTSSEGDATNDVLLGNSPPMQEVYKAIGRVAPQDITVLIRGESGSGKELVARAIYHHSRRANGAFLAVNCAALTESLLESELFGHERGAFTGAIARRIGKFEQCSGGTLFLDEIGDMAPSVQGKVLRALQEQRFERVGGTETVHADVRVIAATNRDLERMVANNEFREDLFYRLNGFTITLAPLRERPEDVLILLNRYLNQFGRQLGKEVQGISPDALGRLLKYEWPGNVRQLQNVLRQSILKATGPMLIADFLPPELQAESAAGEGAPGDDSVASDLAPFVDRQLRAESNSLYAETTAFMDRFLLIKVMRATDGNQSKAAKLLGMTRGSLRAKIRALGISIQCRVMAAQDLPEHDDSDSE
jgi:two-component system nitrogen regulation response regulator GlnG